jgi:O-succinylhomoserine sulfhydrylase
MHPITKAIRIQTERTAQMEHSTPLFITSSFCFDEADDMRAAFAEENSDNIYSRFSNPNVQEFTNKMCALEGAEDGFSTATGMSAIFATFMTFLNSGDHLISCSSVFGSTHTIITKYFPKWGINYSYADATKPETWESLFTASTKMLYVETPTNPGLDIIDLDWLGKLCKNRNVILVVDNCFATPLLQRPIEFGADLVIHSATKWIDGQGRVLGGVIVGKKELIREIYLFSRNTGPSLSPFNAWVLSKSLETLDVRIQRHCDNAEKLVGSLEGNSKLNWIKYPFNTSHPMHEIAIKQMKRGGGLITFDLKGGLGSGVKFMDALQMLTLTSNLGDTRSIASHPASTTHSKLSDDEKKAVGITPGLIRISVGLEFIDDINSDILQALEKS